MSNFIGLDIGGTKIAGTALDAQGRETGHVERATPDNLAGFLEVCRAVAEELGPSEVIGVAARGAFDRASGVMLRDANLPYLSGIAMRAELERILGRRVVLENDANCAALAEAVDGAAAGYKTSLSLIVGTGVGAGYIVDGQIVVGANGFCGEVGHLPLPYYEESDGPKVACGCGQLGCIEKLIAGPALARLYAAMTGKVNDGRAIAELARAGDAGALRVLDRYYTAVAKAMIAILHSFDPDVIVVSGGLNGLPGLYEAVPARWGRFALAKQPKTAFVPAKYGALAGLRGAALLARLG